MPLIETDQFQSLCDLGAGDTDFILSVIDAFLGQLDTVPGQVREALAGNEGEDVARLAHSLKGSAANVGAQDLSEVCRSLETTARKGDFAAARGFAEELTRLAQETRDAYEAARARIT